MGSFSADEIQLSIPLSLLHLVKMIEHGLGIKSQLENDRCKSDLTTAQLLMCKLPSKYQQKDSARHSLERETPFSVYLGLLIYAKMWLTTR
jgi:hypothetical protein